MTRMTFTLIELETLAAALDFWIDNVAQENTDKAEFLRAQKLLKRIGERLAFRYYSREERLGK